MSRALFYACTFALAPSAFADDVDRQGFPTFTSIVDGQPAEPWRMQVATRVAATSERVDILPQVAITPGEHGGFARALIGVSMPNSTTTADESRYSAIASVFWQQRWIEESGAVPTVGTVVTGASESESHANTATLTMFAIHTIGPIVGYASVVGEVSDDNDRAFTGVLGLKLPAWHDIEVGGAMRDRLGSVPAFELSAVVPLTSDLTVGPGLMLEPEELIVGTCVFWML